jgi:hypothetical protein
MVGHIPITPRLSGLGNLGNGNVLRMSRQTCVLAEEGDDIPDLAEASGPVVASHLLLGPSVKASFLA